MPSRLKALELHGYKTFANRTIFEFAEAITAIVGPNGSGKSNIADSIRWVLGEQSYSLLRGKKTEDMIFSGSENRPRAGMATASITFDNSDGWLPIDFSEVAITRRAYRDGQNEYLINGQRVRLKDVSELLAQSGLAERTYTVIGQGLVDAALSLKAGERRRLFEEAAGIGLYRSRREEAIRRLDVTQRNLERVQDIMAELRPRLRSLERQAARAREYEQVQVDLQELLREYYGYHWNFAQKELADSRKAVKVREANLVTVRREQGEIEDRLAKTRKHIQALRADLNAWHRRVADLHTRREALSRQLAVAEERARAISAAHGTTEEEWVNRQGELRLFQDGLADDESEIQRLNIELEEARAQASRARAELEARQVEREQAERQLEAMRQELSSFHALQGQLAARLSESRGRTERASSALQEIVVALRAAEALGEQARADQQRAQRQVEVAQQALEEAQKAVQAAQEHQQTLENERKDLDQARARVEAGIARIQAQLDVLDHAEASLTGYAGGTRLLLDAARQGRFSGARGALINFLEVPAELETAITAALGEYLDAVLLDAEPDQALDLLIGEAARGALLPLSQIKLAAQKPHPPEPDDADVLGLAARLVKAPEELRPALDLFLGQVYVVRDRRAARRLLVGQPPGVRAVTLRGEVFYASGPVQTGGVNAQSSDQTLLGRARQRRELGGIIKASHEQRTNLERRLEQLAREIKARQVEAGKLAQAEESARKAHVHAISETSRARIALEGIQRQVDWQQVQRKRLQDEVLSAESQSVAISSDLDGLVGQIESARDRLRNASDHLTDLSLDEFQSQYAHWNTLAAVAEQAVSDARARRGERLATIQRLEQMIASIQARLGALDQERASLEESQAAWRQDEITLAAEIRSLQDQIDPAEAALDSVENEQAQLQEVESAVRGKLSQSEHYHAQTRISLARRQEALETWRRRIEDDLGLVAFEYADQISGPTPLPFKGLVEQLPMVEKLSPELEEAIRRQRAQLKRIGPINPEAQEEYKEVRQRFEFLAEQVSDLRKAEADVRQVIQELDRLMEREFQATFNAVASEFRSIFTRLFGGGYAHLVLTDPEDLTETGIDIEARLPGRRSQGLSLLSGGERSLTATALVFALLRVSPTPFCVLDEVDAMLDEVNVERFRELLSELSEHTQFVIVTHNRNTVQAADVIYGVTMGRDSVSQVLSLKLDEISRIVD
jgi:chromosome segregation protein